MPPKIANARETIMNFGREQLLKKGPGFSVAGLMDECGMATGTFYSYFHSKDDLLLQLVEEDWNKIVADLDAIVGPALSQRGKAEFIFDRLRIFANTYKFAQMKMAMRMPLKYYLQHQARAMKKMTDKIQEILEDDARAGRVALHVPTDKAAKMIMAVCLAVGRDPELSFSDLWYFMHVREQ